MSATAQHPMGSPFGSSTRGKSMDEHNRGRAEDEARMDRARLTARANGTFQTSYSDRFALRHAKQSLSRVHDIQDAILGYCAEMKVLAGQLGETDLRSTAQGIEDALQDNLPTGLWARNLADAEKEWER